MPDTAEALLGRIQSGADGFLACREVVFAGNRSEEKESRSVSQLRQSNGDDYPEAAGRHILDSRALVARRRFDGAAYLAGYVVECTLKTLIQLETGRADYSHDLPGLLDQLDALAARVGARHGRVYLAVEASLRSSDIVDIWNPGQRYRGPEASASLARAWHRAATDAHRRVFGRLNLAGVI